MCRRCARRNATPATSTDVAASRENLPLLAELLAEQRRLQTPVARLAEAHERGGGASSLASARAQLIPLSAPAAGERYAFEVDLDACSGCKSCVAACHALNGLDETETWRDVGLLVGGDERHPFQQTITTACHHCEDPACLVGCPVLAYEQDPATGIVRHLDDQCIGCQYCVLKCPYDVPKYNPRLGIVRKCDLCHGRLAAGEAPACAQACPTQAITIVKIPTAGPAGRTAAFLPGAPAADYTRPTTRYLTARVWPAAVHLGDIGVLRPQPPHWPLAIMLTLLPLALGAQAAAMSLRWSDATAGGAVARLGAAAGLSGLLASVAHLGRPERAWRIFLGWRRSWLSREAMIFGMWAGLTGVALIDPAWGWPAVAAGSAGLGCSVMVYADTRRRAWRWAQTAIRFFGGAAALGLVATVALDGATWPRVLGLAGVTLAKLACDALLVRPAGMADDDAMPTAELDTARLLSGPLRMMFGLRGVAAVVGGVGLPAMLAAGAARPGVAWGAFALVLAGELLDRHLFFRSVDAPKMPGLPA
jgi:formate dehydrogenase iron-sulfur subunit